MAPALPAALAEPLHQAPEAVHARQVPRVLPGTRESRARTDNPDCPAGSEYPVAAALARDPREVPADTEAKRWLPVVRRLADCARHGQFYKVEKSNFRKSNFQRVKVVQKIEFFGARLLDHNLP